MAARKTSVTKTKREGVTAGSEASPPGGAKQPPAKRTTKRDGGFPFLFYGRLPTDFGDHVTGHPYEIRFAEAPDDAGRAALARAFEQAAHGTLVEPPPANQPWLWSGPWALVRLFESSGTPGPDEPGFTKYFDHVEKVLRALHQVRPITEVVYGFASGHGLSSWDRFTEEHKPAPEPHPPAGGYHRAFGAPRKAPDLPATEAPSLPPATPDAAFEAARAAARDELTRAEADRRLKQAAAKGGIALMPIEERDVPPPPEAPAWMTAACEALAPPRPRQPPTPRWHIERAATGAYVALISPDATRNILAVVDAEGPPPRTVDLPRLAGRRVLRLRPDGGAALYADARSLFEVSLPEVRARILWTVEHAPGDDDWVEALYLPDGRIAASTTRGLHLLARDETELRPADFVPLPGDYHELAITSDGRFLVATTASGTAGTTVFGLRDAELRVIGMIKQEARGPFARGGRLFVDSKGKLAEIVRLDAAYEAAFAAPTGDPPRVRLAAEAAALLERGEVALVPVDDVPPAEPIPAAVRARFDDALGVHVVAGAGGSYLALVHHGSRGGKSDVRVALLASTDDTPRPLELPSGGYRLLSLSRDGTRALLCAIPPNNVLEIALPSGQVRWLTRREAYGGAYAPGDRVVLFGPHFGLELFERQAEGLAKISDVPMAEAAELASAFDGEVVATRTPGGDVAIFTVSEAGFALVAQLKERVAHIYARGDRLFATVEGVRCEIRGVPRPAARP
ncbi:hypothetical protein [Sorangium cellulosum]|uniref:Uncharacterized protein n=1 Tax=Sorangium cellulosum TaxID=56 RepID=A0A150QTG2_SORCE|nr:hypothetical protein [Sorangium cellulosum]KYF70858.1 hypothetical protein BE15_30600 [Sorangium cellulosum]